MKSYYFLIKNIGCWWAERQILNTAKEHLKLGENVYIFTLSNNCFFDIPKGVTYIPLSHIKNSYLRLFLTPVIVRKLKKYLKKYQLDEWISFLELPNIIHLLARRNAKISLRTHISLYDYYYWFLWLKPLFWKIMIKIFYPKAWKIIVNSRESKIDLVHFLNISEDKVDVMYNYIDKEEIKLLKNEEIDRDILDKLKNKRVFITTGRLVFQKRHDKIIKALSTIKNEDWIFLIIWTWEKEKELKELSKKLWISDKILFLGKQKNVFKYLNIADIFLYISDVEWLPNTLLEARELWLKIITNDFKSWAREIILWEDTLLLWKTLQYPFYWKYGIIIDNKNCVEQLSNLLGKDALIKWLSWK